MKKTETKKTTAFTLPERLKVFSVKTEHGTFWRAKDGEQWYDIKFAGRYRPNFSPVFVDTTDGVTVEETDYAPLVTVTDADLYAPYYDTEEKEVKLI